MPRDDWKNEAQDAMRHEAWTLRGPGRVVKVVPIGLNKVDEVKGYIVLGKFLVGQTPAQIQCTLGLPIGKFVFGMRVYSFRRLPMPSEYTYELTTAYPDGLAYNQAHSHPDYLPGGARVIQWCIKKDVVIPVDATSSLELHAGQLFPMSWLMQ